MAWISFSFYKDYYYFLVFWILELAISIIKYFFEVETSNKNEIYYKENAYFNLISLNIADLLAGFLVLFTEIQMKTKKKEEIKKTKNTQELIYNDYSIKRNKFIYIFIISIFNLLGSSIELFYYLFYEEQINKENFEWLISVDIITRIIFSKIILKTRLYKHHFISLVIFFIGFLPMTIFGILNPDNYLYIFLVFIKNTLYAIGDIFSKILLTEKFVLPHYLIFWKGIFVFFIHIILFNILFFTVGIRFSYFYNDTFSIIFLRIFNIVILLPKNLCVMKVIYLFTPHHVGFLNVVISLKNYILYISSKGTKNAIFVIITILSLFIVIIGTLIFNEMIIVKVFGLDKDTKPGMLHKEKLDLLDMDSSVLEEDLKNEEEQNETKD